MSASNNLTGQRMSIIVVLLLATAYQGAFASVDYSASDDASWAIRSTKLSNLLGANKQRFYDDFIQNCNEASRLEKAPEERDSDDNDCTYNDLGRIEMNRSQPPSVYNYTESGYKKSKAPEKLFRLIRDFYDNNKDNAEQEWPSVNNYQNSWETQTTLIRLQDPRLKGGGAGLEREIFDASQGIMEEWVGQQLKAVSLYGVRQYYRGSLLAPHVDRMPLITSAIINVDQEEMEEPWVLEVYGHDGKAANISMEVGDMVLYESHSVIHGRPFPLMGKLYANVFLHFEPLADDDYDPELGIPPYLIPDSPWEEHWWDENPEGWQGEKDEEWEEIDPWMAAQQGDYEVLRIIAEEDPEALFEADDQGWHPIHEAVRTGMLPVIDLLLKYGADINQATDSGHTPLSLARKHLGDDHEVTTYLLELGAIDPGPDL